MEWEKQEIGAVGKTRSGTFQGSSRLTFFPIVGCCFKTNEALEVTFNADGAISGTKQVEDASSAIPIVGRWSNNKLVWLETGRYVKKKVSNGFLVSSKSVWTIKGDYYSTKSDFGKFHHKCSALQETTASPYSE